MNQCCAQCALARTRWPRHYQSLAAAFDHRGMKNQKFVSVLVDAPIEPPFEERHGQSRRKRLKGTRSIKVKQNLRSDPTPEAHRVGQPYPEVDRINIR